DTAARGAHHSNDLLNARRVGWTAPALVARRPARVMSGQGCRRARPPDGIEQDCGGYLSSDLAPPRAITAESSIAPIVGSGRRTPTGDALVPAGRLTSAERGAAAGHGRMHEVSAVPLGESDDDALRA